MPAARTPRRNGPYAPLSAFYADDDAVIALEDAGDDLSELLFLRGLAHCAREPKLNGYVSLVKVRSGRIIRRPAAKLMKAAARLVEVGLWAPDGDGGWRIKRWEKWNSTHEEIVERQVRDAARKAGQNGSSSARNGDGSTADSARNDSGIRDDSAPYVSTRHVTSQQGTSDPHHSSGSTCDPPPLPPAISDLAARLAVTGILVSWQLDDADQQTALAALDRCGVQALVKQARAQYRPDDPAHSAKAFLAGWAALPGSAARLELVDDPCEHGETQRIRCALCRSTERAAS